MSIYVVATVNANGGFAGELKVALLDLVKHSRTEKGCIKYDLHVSSENASEFMFYEIWESQIDLDEHSNSQFMKQFGAMAKDWIAAVHMKTYQSVS